MVLLFTYSFDWDLLLYTYSHKQQNVYIKNHNDKRYILLSVVWCIILNLVITNCSQLRPTSLHQTSGSTPTLSSSSELSTRTHFLWNYMEFSRTSSFQLHPLFSYISRTFRDYVTLELIRWRRMLCYVIILSTEPFI